MDIFCPEAAALAAAAPETAAAAAEGAPSADVFAPHSFTVR